MTLIHIFRALASGALLWVVWHNAHWSVAALLTWLVLWRESVMLMVREGIRRMSRGRSV